MNTKEVVGRGRSMETAVYEAQDLWELIDGGSQQEDSDGMGKRRVVFVNAWPREAEGDDHHFILLMRRCGMEIDTTTHRWDRSVRTVVIHFATGQSADLAPHDLVEVLVPSDFVWKGEDAADFEIVPPDLYDGPGS